MHLYVPAKGNIKIAGAALRCHFFLICVAEVRKTPNFERAADEKTGPRNSPTRFVSRVRGASPIRRGPPSAQKPRRALLGLTMKAICPTGGSGCLVECQTKDWTSNQ